MSKACAEGLGASPRGCAHGMRRAGRLSSQPGLVLPVATRQIIDVQTLLSILGFQQAREIDAHERCSGGESRAARDLNSPCGQVERRRFQTRPRPVRKPLEMADEISHRY